MEQTTVSTKPRPITHRFVTANRLSEHLSIHPNQVPAVVRKFGLERCNGGFQIGDIFRRIHKIEPVRLQSCLSKLRADHTTPDKDLDGTPICLVGEIAEIDDFATAIWEDGLKRNAEFAEEYGYSDDYFRKKLKAGEVDLPPVAPIQLSKRKIMYRPIDVFLWCRYRISIDWPVPADAAPCRPAQARDAACDSIFSTIMSDTIADQDAQENRNFLRTPPITGELPP